jgi:hypothetical protein
MVTNFGRTQVLLWEGAAPMTSAPVHDPLSDHLLTPQNAAFPLRLTGHPVVRWYEPGEDWYGCYLDRLVSEFESAPAAPSHP